MSDTNMIIKKLAAIQAEIPAIGKQKKQGGLAYAFRSIDTIIEAVHGLLIKHNVIIIPHVIDTQRATLDRFDKRTGNKIGHTISVALTVKYDFICSDDGSKIEAGPSIGEANDTGDKACSKAMTYALKNMLIQLFSIPVSGSNQPNNNNQSDTPPTMPPVATPPPNEFEQVFIDKVAEVLLSCAPERQWPDTKKVGNAVYSIDNRYPSDITKAKATADYLVKKNFDLWRHEE